MSGQSVLILSWGSGTTCKITSSLQNWKQESRDKMAAIKNYLQFFLLFLDFLSGFVASEPSLYFSGSLNCFRVIRVDVDWRAPLFRFCRDALWWLAVPVDQSKDSVSTGSSCSGKRIPGSSSLFLTDPDGPELEDCATCFTTQNWSSKHKDLQLLFTSKMRKWQLLPRETKHLSHEGALCLWRVRTVFVDLSPFDLELTSWTWPSLGPGDLWSQPGSWLQPSPPAYPAPPAKPRENTRCQKGSRDLEEFVKPFLLKQFLEWVATSAVNLRRPPWL